MDKIPNVMYILLLSEIESYEIRTKNAPITTEKITEQFSKTQNTCFEFSNIEISLDDNLFIPTSILNDIRREAISRIEAKILDGFKREYSDISFDEIESFELSKNLERKKSLLLNILHTKYDYSNLKEVDRIYVPLKYFSDKKYCSILSILSEKSKLYIYMPVVVKDRFLDNINNAVNKAISDYDISGIVVSEISSLEYLKEFNLDLIANYNFNVYNTYTANILKNLGFSTITLSPELDGADLGVINVHNKELIVYGKIPLMTMSYCLLGKSNKCYDDCKHLCLSNDEFYLNDRYNFNFRAVPDNSQTFTTIYNSRNISVHDAEAEYARFDILDESIEEINELIEN